MLLFLTNFLSFFSNNQTFDQIVVLAEKFENLQGRNRMPSSGLRPLDYNGGLGTLSKVLPREPDPNNPGSYKPQRFQVAVNDGSTLALKAENCENHIEVKGRMTMYARMQMRFHDMNMLAADIDYSSSDTDENDENMTRSGSIFSMRTLKSHFLVKKSVFLVQKNAFF